MACGSSSSSDKQRTAMGVVVAAAIDGVWPLSTDATVQRPAGTVGWRLLDESCDSPWPLGRACDAAKRVVEISETVSGMNAVPWSLEANPWMAGRPSTETAFQNNPTLRRHLRQPASGGMSIAAMVDRSDPAGHADHRQRTASGPVRLIDEGGDGAMAGQLCFLIASVTASPIVAGVGATTIPASSSAATFSVAVPLPPEMMAPA